MPDVCFLFLQCVHIVQIAFCQNRVLDLLLRYLKCHVVGDFKGTDTCYSVYLPVHVVQFMFMLEVISFFSEFVK